MHRVIYVKNEILPILLSATKLNGQQLEPEVNLAKKVKYTQAMADELSRDTVL